MDGDVPRSTSYGVYISQLIRFARVSSHVVDFNARNKSLTAKLLQQGYRYYKLRKTFSKFYRRHYELVSKFNVGLKTLLHQGLRGARWLSGRVSDSGARGPGFETYRRRVVSLSKTLYSPKVLVNYPGSDGSVPT